MTGDAWGLAQYQLAGDASAHTGVLVDGAIRSLPPELDIPLLDMLNDWDSYVERLRALDPRAGGEALDATLLAPITFPRKLLCAGTNYYGHALEMGTARPDPLADPFLFLKPPTTAISAHGATVPLPDGLRDPRLDWEAELAVVISRRARNIRASDAGGHIAGYTIANDLSARGLFDRPNAVMAPFAYDWLLQKGQDGCCPLGPAIIPAWLIRDPQDLQIQLFVNGVIKQDSSTSDMVVGAYEMVAAASRFVTLEPGDVVLTGTPAGVGLPREEFLQPGDVVTVRIERLGELTTAIGEPIAPAVTPAVIATAAPH